MSTMRDDPRYRNKVTCLSFAMAVEIVYTHAINLAIYQNGALYYLQMVIYNLTGAIVRAFFVLSGFLFYQNYEPAILRRKWKTRFQSIVVPYLVWNAIAYLYYAILSALPPIRAHLSSSAVDFTIRGLITEAVLGGHNVTWFLFNLIIYIYISPALYPALKKRYLGVAVIVAITVCGVLLEEGHIMLSLYYLTGAYLAIHFSELVKKRYPKRMRLIAGCVFFALTLGGAPFELGFFAARIKILCQIVSLWVMADVFAVDTMPRWWMKLSFFIYCAHSMILESFEKAFFILAGDTSLAAAIDFLFMPMLTVACVIGIAAILKKIPPIWKILIGNRSI